VEIAEARRTPKKTSIKRGCFRPISGDRPWRVIAGPPGGRLHLTNLHVDPETAHRVRTPNARAARPGATSTFLPTDWPIDLIGGRGRGHHHRQPGPRIDAELVANIIITEVINPTLKEAEAIAQADAERRVVVP
jgi:hypothetical protein